jgi:tetratricopeptide (TPR) repeat protein
MADPFSIIVGALSLTRTCVTLTKILVATKESLTNAGSEADDAMKELSGLKSVCESVQNVCQRVRKDYESPALSVLDTRRLKGLCSRLAVSVEDCKEYMSKLELLLIEIFGPKNAPAGRIATIRSATKHLFKKNDLQEIHRKISTHSSNIQSQMTGLNSFYQMIHIDHTWQCLTTLSTMNSSIQILQTSMQSVHLIVDQFLQPVPQSSFRPSLFSVRSISLIDVGTTFVGTRKVLDSCPSTICTRSRGSYQRVDEDFSLSKGNNEASSLVPAQATRLVPTSLKPQARLSSKSEAMIDGDINEFFLLPYSPDSNFVARSNLLTELVTILNPSTQGHASSQRLVVISGEGGMGKTHLALKVADALRDSFFGVFWINASSDQLARASWADIARIFGLEPDFHAICNYFATLQKPWLLIVDNADDPYIHIEDYIPSGDLGCIVITTRHAAIKHLGTVGQKHYPLDRLSDEQCIQLLRTEARRRGPFSQSDVKLASQLAGKLSHLPLALSMAGQYISKRASSLESYMELQDRALEKRQQEADSTFSRTLLSTLDLSVQMLDDDALQVLELLSFFHPDNIPVDIFLGSFQRRHPEKATGADELTVDGEFASTRPKSSLQILHRLCLALGQLLQGPTLQQLYRTPSVLPKVFQASCTDPGAAEARVKAALKALECFSLVVIDDQTGMVRMHRVVWEFIKTRFRSIAQEAVACEAALAILTNCIEIEEETLANAVEYVDSRFLLPHIIQARQRSQDILMQYQIRQQSSERLCSLTPRFWWSASTSTRSDPRRLMKFSAVYFSSGEYQQARILQEEARAVLLLMWGTMLNPQCVHVSFALALTYHRLHLFDKAVELQRQTIQATETLYGKEHNTAFSMTDVLGLFLLSRGDLSESLQRSQQAQSGLEKLHENDPQHKTALAALNHLGAVQAQYYRWNESKKLCEMAMKGLQKIDPQGNEIWLAKQNIAIADIHLSDTGSFAEAESLMTDVYNHWRRCLGDEHPTTLLAIFTMSRVLLRRGKIEEAKELLLPALDVAESRLGSKDFGFQAARVLLACIQLHQRSFTQAEQILVDVNDIYTEMNFASDHMDRVVALWYLMECYKEQYKFDDALEVYEEMSDSIKTSMSFNLRAKHPLAKNLNAKRQELEALKQRARMVTMLALEANLNEPGRTVNTAPEGEVEKVADKVEV